MQIKNPITNQIVGKTLASLQNCFKPANCSVYFHHTNTSERFLIGIGQTSGLRMNQQIKQVLSVITLLLLLSNSGYSLPNGTVGIHTAAFQQNNYVKDISILEDLASLENDFAEYALGVMYEFGTGVQANRKNAEDWYRKAALRGNVKAQQRLGDWYAGGTKVPQDYKQAVYWWLMAAKQGDALSQYNLGYAYQQGRGRLLKDYKQAVFWYKQSAESGDSDAQVKLGLAYYLGKGVPRDEAKAANWYKKSAAQNNYNAQYFLGLALCEGRGIRKNLVQCATWIRKAHENGDPNASKVWETYELWEHQ